MSEATAEASQGTQDRANSPRRLDLSSLPPVYILATHLSLDEQHEAENMLCGASAPVTYDMTEARLVLANLAHPRRARLELQWQGMSVEDITSSDSEDAQMDSLMTEDHAWRSKRRLINRESTSHSQKATRRDSVTSDAENDSTRQENPSAKPQLSVSYEPDSSTNTASDASDMKETRLADRSVSVKDNQIVVVRIEWLSACNKTGSIQPLKSFLLLKVRRKLQSSVVGSSATPDPGNDHENVASHKPQSSNKVLAGVLERAKADIKPNSRQLNKRNRIDEAASQDIVGKSFASSTQAEARSSRRTDRARPGRLLHQTTSENEDASDLMAVDLPEWVRQNKIYSCERSTPADSPNEEFIDLLKKIRLARELIRDEIGIRAYSTSIASLSAFPRRFRSGREILDLPGCDQKIAHLWREYKENDGRLRAVDEIDSDPALTVLQEFYKIWGVGAVTAREFYYYKGWRDLDDIIEFGWASLSRVQQIGLKYYDEFLLPIPRSEVEIIASTIARHATLVTDDCVQCAIVGGYRRGKPESGDVDVILSHPDECQTLNVIEKIVKSLESEGWITHTLTLHNTTSHRNQETLPINTGTAAGRGFDSLDKALVVWQDLDWPTKHEDRAADPKAKNPNPHRRVDIIISPWRTVGCAVAGWTSGTTFQRDLRRYCKYVKGWKFDSSGVRERGSGRWVDLEGWRNEQTRSKTWQDAERRVFKGLGLEWREPWERCTG